MNTTSNNITVLMNSFLDKLSYNDKLKNFVQTAFERLIYCLVAQRRNILFDQH